MLDLTPLERFQLKFAARRDRLLRRIRWRKAIMGSPHRELARRRLSGEIGSADFAALRDAQRLTPRNEQLKRLSEAPRPESSDYAGDESWN